MQLGIISDIHEDIISLKKAFSILNKKQVDEIVCLGDIVGFSKTYYKYDDSRNAHECISMVKSNCNIVIKGNHDLFAIKKLSEFNAGITYPPNWFDLTYAEKLKFSKDKLWLYEDELPLKLNKNEIEYLNSLPEYIISEYDKTKYLFSHFLYPDISGAQKKFSQFSRKLKSHRKFMNNNNCKIGICGHAHINGAIIRNKKNSVHGEFGKFNFDKTANTIIIGPCIAEGENPNGLIIINTDTSEIEVIQISSEITKN